MSLINDMLRDLDARRAHSAPGTLTALPAAGIGGPGNDLAHPGPARLFAGLAMFTVLAVSVPVLTDTLEVFAWGGPGGPVIVTKITLPAQEARQPRPRAVTVEPQSHTMSRPAPAQAPAVTASQADASEAPVPPAVSTETVTDTAQVDSTPANDETTPDIVLRRHGTGYDYRRAAGAAAAGNDQDAMALLENILVQQADHHQARLLLARLYLRQQQPGRAVSLLQDGLASYPLQVPYARLLANMLVTVDRLDEAIGHLLTALPAAMRDADYHALLAGLYQRNDKPATAVRHYTTALTLAPEHGEWWMGLGISQEQAGNRDAAYTAYRRALQHRLDATLRDYIAERLRRLSQERPAGVTNKLPNGKV
jgi:MSHA biogenesis protein MshN